MLLDSPLKFQTQSPRGAYLSAGGFGYVLSSSVVYSCVLSRRTPFSSVLQFDVASVVLKFARKIAM